MGNYLTDCLCFDCRRERRKALGDEAANAEENRAREAAGAIFGNVGAPQEKPPASTDETPKTA